MNISLIGTQIAKFRKALGLTQEELGKRVGVSTQAVSRWECGGAPDIGLLPAIADTLGVTVDALFGREGGEAADPAGAFRRWAGSLPPEEFWRRSVPLFTTACIESNYTGGKMPTIDLLESCLVQQEEGETALYMSAVCADDGYAIASVAKDLQFFSIHPEPEAGYAAYFASPEAYRSLFAALAQPGVLELLLALYREQDINFTAAAMAKRTGLSRAEAETALRTLQKAGVLDRTKVELEDGPTDAWCVRMELPLIPFLLYARYLLQGKSLNYFVLGPRVKPWLKKEAANETA